MLNANYLIINSPDINKELNQFFAEKTNACAFIDEYNDITKLLHKVLQINPQIICVDYNFFNPADLETFFTYTLLYNTPIFVYGTNKDINFRENQSNVHLLEYLISPEHLFNKLQIALKKQTKEQILFPNKQSIVSNKYIGFSSMSKIDVTAIKDIIYLEAAGKYTSIHVTDNTKLTSSKNIGHYEKLLNDDLFYRIHHKYLVNLEHVQFFDWSKTNSCILIDNTTSLPVSKRKKAGLVSFLTKDNHR